MSGGAAECPTMVKREKLLGSVSGQGQAVDARETLPEPEGARGAEEGREGGFCRSTGERRQSPFVLPQASNQKMVKWAGGQKHERGLGNRE